MVDSKKSSSPANVTLEQGLVFLLLAWGVFWGAFVRFYPALSGDTPINDGGLFLMMTEELQNAGFHMPVYSQFNSAQIPYAYPPLSLYLSGWISSLAGIPIFQLFRLLPPFLATITIPLVYLLARKFLRSNLEAALAAAMYAMIPRGFLWFIMGGGIPRSLGAIFSISFLIFILNFFSSRKPRYFILSSVSLALLILSHPEWLYHTLWILMIFWVCTGDRLANAIRLIGVGILAALFTSPWWLTILLRYGAAAYLSAAQTGGFSPFFWTPLLAFTFTEEPYIGIIACLALLGILVIIRQKRWILLLWIVVPFAVEVRNAAAIAAIPLSILAGVGFFQIVMPGITYLEKRTVRGRMAARSEAFGGPLSLDDNFIFSLSAKILLSFLLVYSLLNAFAYSLRLSTLRLTSDDISAMEWIRGNTPQDSRILIIGVGGEFDMPLQEWMPALTGRINPAVVQGYEWTDGGAFFDRLRNLNALSACSYETSACIEDWSQERQIPYQYVLVRFQPYPFREEPRNTGGLLAYTLSDSPDYRLLYANPTLTVFARSAP
jgi:hypothetical protein